MEDLEVIITWVNYSSHMWLNLKANLKVPDNRDLWSDSGEIFMNLQMLELNKQIKRVHLVVTDDADNLCFSEFTKVLIHNVSDVAHEVWPTTNSYGIESLLHTINVSTPHFIYLNDDMFMNPNTIVDFPHNYHMMRWFEPLAHNKHSPVIYNTFKASKQLFGVDPMIIPNHRYYLFNTRSFQKCSHKTWGKYNKTFKTNKFRTPELLDDGGDISPVYLCLISQNSSSIKIYLREESTEYWRDYRDSFLSLKFDFINIQTLHQEPPIFRKQFELLAIKLGYSGRCFHYDYDQELSLSWQYS
jgi:hypothetical protein